MPSDPVIMLQAGWGAEARENCEDEIGSNPTMRSLVFIMGWRATPDSALNIYGFNDSKKGTVDGNPWNQL